MGYLQVAIGIYLVTNGIIEAWTCDLKEVQNLCINIIGKRLAKIDGFIGSCENSNEIAFGDTDLECIYSWAHCPKNTGQQHDEFGQAMCDLKKGFQQYCPEFKKKRKKRRTKQINTEKRKCEFKKCWKRFIGAEI